MQRIYEVRCVFHCFLAAAPSLALVFQTQHQKYLSSFHHIGHILKSHGACYYLGTY